MLFEKRHDPLIHLTTQEIRGLRWCSCLRHCATSCKVAGSIPDVVVFIDIILPAAIWPWGDSVSDRNDYQEFSLRVKAAGAWDSQTYHTNVPIILKCGSIKLLETSGPVQACTVIVLPFTRESHRRFIILISTFCLSVCITFAR